MPSRPQSDIRAIVLDFNGTLAQDTDLVAQIYIDTFASIGAKLTVGEYQHELAALADREVFELAMRRVGLGRDRVRREALIEERIERYMVAVLDDPPIDEAAIEFVQSASASVPLAIASNAFRREIEEVIAAAGIDEHFSALVTIDEVTKGKPDPEPFVLALASLRARSASAARSTPSRWSPSRTRPGGRSARARPVCGWPPFGVRRSTRAAATQTSCWIDSTWPPLSRSWTWVAGDGRC